MEELKKPMISKEVENGGETVISEEIRKINEYYGTMVWAVEDI